MAASVSTFSWYRVIDLDVADPDDASEEFEDAAMSTSTAVSATPDPTCQATTYSGALLAVANAVVPSCTGTCMEVATWIDLRKVASTFVADAGELHFRSSEISPVLPAVSS